MVAPIETLYDLLRRDEIELPDFIGLGGYHYRDCTLADMVRVWQYLYENSERIEVDGYEPVSAFESDHQPELLRRADELGVSTVQAPIAQDAALHIQQEGFGSWRDQQFEQCGQTFIWRPTDESEWTGEKQAKDFEYAFGENPFHTDESQIG